MIDKRWACSGYVNVIPKKLVRTNDIGELYVSAIGALTDIERIRRLNATEIRLPNEFVSGRCGLEAENTWNGSVAQPAMGDSNAVAQVRLRRGGMLPREK